MVQEKSERIPLLQFPERQPIPRNKSTGEIKRIIEEAEDEDGDHPVIGNLKEINRQPLTDRINKLQVKQEDEENNQSQRNALLGQ